MDLSKLPGRTDARSDDASSNASPGAPVLPLTEPQPPLTLRPAPAAPGPEVWINALVGLLLIGLGFHFARFTLDRMAGQPYHTGVNWTEGSQAGTEVAYFDLAGDSAWTDAGLFVLGCVVLLEAAVAIVSASFPPAPATVMLMLALLLTAGAVLFNAYVCFRFFHNGIMPMMSACAVVFGLWVSLDEWRALQRIRAADGV